MTYTPNQNFMMKRGLPGEQNLYNAGYRLEITHVPTNYSVAFSAFIDQLSDSFTSTWNSERVFGRMDPIGKFANTGRAISVVWTVPASNWRMARDNFDKMNRLASFLYPVYSDNKSATSINSGPLWKVKFGNLISNAVTGGPLAGWVQGITIDPNLEEGLFTIPADHDSEIFPPELDAGLQEAWASGMVDLPVHPPRMQPVTLSPRLPKVEGQPHGPSLAILPVSQDVSDEFIDGNYQNPNLWGVNYYPKSLKLNFEMTVLHEHNLGWGIASDSDMNEGPTYYFRGSEMRDKKTGEIIEVYGSSFPYPSARVNDQPLDQMNEPGKDLAGIADTSHLSTDQQLADVGLDDTPATPQELRKKTVIPDSDRKKMVEEANKRNQAILGGGSRLA